MGDYLLPVFNEYIQFLKDKTNNDSRLEVLKEGYYWVDRLIIKSFDKKGNIQKLLRISINNNLDISLKSYEGKYNKEIESWYDTSVRLQDRLIHLEAESIRTLEKYKDTDRIIIDTNSTGKDSMVKTHLAILAGLNFKTYFNVTTCDVADSNKMAKRNKYIHIFPDRKLQGLYSTIKRENTIPSRLNRSCCRRFKEEPTIKYFNENDKLLFLFGMRNDESLHRADYQNEWINEKWGNRDWIGLLPIRKWTDLDIWLYIIRNYLEINQKYKKGYQRVGCGIVCPNYNKSTWVLDQYWYPKLYQRWQDILKNDFLDNYKWISVHCTLEEYLQGAWAGGLLRKEPSKEVINEFAKYKSITYDVAIKYFDKYCDNSCKSKNGKLKKIKSKDVIAMNLKFLGRNTEKFMCKKCLIKYLNIDENTWNKYIDDFKNSGCNLF